jgi:succinate dehydrogenase flavin-adding protein (antitoxin of CptAB toxin-antitoxin module)
VIQLDSALLDTVGLRRLPDWEKDLLLRHLYETLETRVGLRLADRMTNTQLDEFEQFFEAEDDDGAFEWLESNFPDYKDIVTAEFEALKADLMDHAPQILRQSRPGLRDAPPSELEAVAVGNDRPSRRAARSSVMRGPRGR